MMERDMGQVQRPHDSELCEIRTVLLASLVSLSLHGVPATGNQVARVLIKALSSLAHQGVRWYSPN